MLKIIAVCALATLLFSIAEGTDCDEDRLKIYVKINYTEWDEKYEEYLLRATVAYSVQKFCGEINDSGLEPTDYVCGGAAEADTDTTSATNYTMRVSYCIKVVGVDVNTVRAAIKASKANINGALILTDEELVVDGILPTLEPPITYSFEPWLIAYIVFTVLILSGGLLIVYFTMRTPKSKNNEFDDDDKQQLREEENRGYEDEESGGSREDISTRM